MSGGKKVIKVVHVDDVYYPAVTFLRSNMTEVANVLEVPKVKRENAQAAIKNEPAMLTSVVEKASDSNRRRSGWKRWRTRLATAIVAVVVVAATALVGIRLMGFKTFTVLSGSMEPEYPVGSLLYVKPVDYQALKVGDVISYVANDEKVIVTHRIVDIVKDEKDATVLRFQTKGDANSSADGNLVHYKNIVGTPVIMVPFIGYLAHNIQQPPGIYITLVAGTLLLAWTFLPGTLEERRKTARKSVA